MIKSSKEQKWRKEGYQMYPHQKQCFVVYFVAGN